MSGEEHGSRGASDGIACEGQDLESGNGALGEGIGEAMGWKGAFAGLGGGRGDALRKSKAAEPGVDHAFPSSEDDVVEGVSALLVFWWPFIAASGRCLLSVMAA